MTDHPIADPAAGPKRATAKAAAGEAWRFVAPIAIGLLVAAAGIGPWVLFVRLNATIRPDLPWAAAATLAYLALFLLWLNGAGWPRRWRSARRYRLRLRRSDGGGWSRAELAVTIPLIALLGILTLLWIMIGASREPPDLSRYPTTIYLVSVVLVGPLVAGVVEEAAFRGYMQRGLEGRGAGTAIVVTSIVFALAHGVHGWEALLLLGPGIFIASALYGMLAYHTGSIIPGMIVHFLGDLSYTYFGLLGGDWRLLIVQ